MKKTGPRYFPYLITELCKQACVPTVEGDVWKKGKVTIDGLVIDRLRKNISDARRTRTEVRAAVAAPEFSEVVKRLEEENVQLRKEVKEMKKGQEVMNLKLDALLMGLTDQRIVWKHVQKTEQVKAGVYATLVPETAVAFPVFPTSVLMKTRADEVLASTSGYSPTP